MHPRRFEPHCLVFSEKEMVAGVFVIHSGRIRVSINSLRGKQLTLHTAEEGDFLGLPSLFSRLPSDSSAETISAADISFIGREHFIKFLEEHPAAYLAFVQELCDQLQRTNAQLRIIGLHTSARQKLARLLLHYGERNSSDRSEPNCTLDFTHEEIGQQIGISRETVSRCFAVFKRSHLIRLDGSTMRIMSRKGLQRIANE
jgi:CRP/FNR family transcriptional regulator